MTDTPADADRPTSQSRGRRRPWIWFALGFLIAFIGLLLMYSMYFYDGRGAHETVLWRYYVLEVQQDMRSSGDLGPTSGGGAAMVVVLAEHILFSAVVGALAMAAGAFFRHKRVV